MTAPRRAAAILESTSEEVSTADSRAYAVSALASALEACRAEMEASRLASSASSAAVTAPRRALATLVSTSSGVILAAMSTRAACAGQLLVLLTKPTQTHLLAASQQVHFRWQAQPFVRVGNNKASFRLHSRARQENRGSRVSAVRERVCLFRVTIEHFVPAKW